MNKKEKILKQIDDFESKYFNEDQKIIAKKIIENAPEQEAQEYANFIFMKRRTGFAFDYSPEIAKGRLITLKNNDKLSINIDNEVSDDENKLIIGDNYNALKALLVTHKSKIDIIYIDPPYNTEAAKNDGNDSSKEGGASKFVYKDKFGRGGWLNMMKERLHMAKDLLNQSGVILVSIDDNEQAYLKVLMDDIFGEHNFITNFTWRKKSSPSSEKRISKIHEYILMYSKDASKYSVKQDPFERGEFKEFDRKTKRWWKPRNLQVGTSSTVPYTIKDNKGNEYNPEPGTTWRWSEAKLKENLDSIFFKNGKVYQKEWDKGGQLPKTILNDKRFGLSKTGNTELTNIIGENPFNTVKPVNLIKHLLRIMPHENPIVLDFFAGSGTTAQAVMELNQDEKTNRRFILATNNTNGREKNGEFDFPNGLAVDITYERLFRLIKKTGTKGEDFEHFKRKENVDYNFSDVKLRTIDIDDSALISLDSNEDFLKNENEAIDGLKYLSRDYKPNGIKAYYDLAALNPLESEEEDESN